MRIVVDCNVIISAGITTKGSCAKVIEQVVGLHDWIISAPILEEYLEVIQRPHLERYSPIMEEIVTRVEELGKSVVPVEDLEEGLPDPDDEIYLKTAFSANAGILITGNKKHFPLPKYKDTLILSPREFLDLTWD